MHHRLIPLLELALPVLLLLPAALHPAQSNKRVAPIGRPPGFTEAKEKAEARRKAKEAERLVPPPGAEALPQPSLPQVHIGFAGLDFPDSDLTDDSGGSVPPDTHLAASPTHIVEVVNSTVAYFNKSSGANLFLSDLSVFFESVGAGNFVFDPVVAYDELEGRFIIGAVDVDFDVETAHLLYAVSNTSNPLEGFSEMHRIDVKEFGLNVGENVWGDFPKLGWNADAHVFTLNMFGFQSEEFDHVSVITIDKSTALDKDPATLTMFHVDRDSTHFTMVPAIMHGSVNGDPMWFVEEAGYANGDAIRITRMTNVTSPAPTFIDTDLTVEPYSIPPNATQPGTGSKKIDTNDARMLNAEWRNNRLVASQAVGLPTDGEAHARWYEFNTAEPSPTVTQQGTVDIGAGIHTYYPSVAIAANGDVGMTFMQSSTSEFMSMYVTGRSQLDAPDTMQAPLLAKAGVRAYSAFDCESGSACRAGDYSGIVVDPSFTNTFCAANEYATSASSNNWGTWLACFSITVHDLAVVKITAPKTVRAASPVTKPVKVQIQNRSDHSETIEAADLGDGVGTGLVRLTVSAADDDGEGCNDAVVALNDAKNGKLFAKGPKVLKPKQKLTIHYVVTYDCAGPLKKNKADTSAGDYSYVATVHHDVLDGNADTHAADDVCPHDAPAEQHDPNPPPKGVPDKGCGAKKADGTFGDPVLTDVVN